MINIAVDLERKEEEDQVLNSSQSTNYQTQSVDEEVKGSYYFQDWIEAPRPCYHLLRGLGIWQPSNASCIFKLYSNLIWLFWAAFVVAVFLQNYFHDGTFKIGRILNNFGTILDFFCPLLFLKYYFNFGNYEGLVAYVHEISDADGRKQMEKVRYCYTALSLVMWVIMTIYFTFHWQPFWDHDWWNYVIYIAIIAYTMGWWAVWFSWYAFVCHIHRNQVFFYKKKIVDTLNENIDSDERTQDDSLHLPLHHRQDEIMKISQLLHQFNELQVKLHRTQCDFAKITSIAVTYHILDMFFYSLAYFKKDFTSVKYPLWNYYGTITYDTLSIFVKLFPAASVSQALHNTVIEAGDQCVLLEPSTENSAFGIPYERFGFFQHLYYREQDMGFRILGVKITFRLTFGIVITLGTAMAGFLRLVAT